MGGEVSKSGLYSLPTLIVILVLLTLVGIAGFSLAIKQHLADDSCGSCHLSQSEVTLENSSKLLASQEVLCEKCHENAVKASHPSGFHVERALPENFPLDWKGDLTCSTCHLVHGSDHGLMRVTERGYGLCIQCHDEAFFQSMRDGAESIIHSGHLAVSAESALALDPFSLKCMECHLKEASTRSVYLTGDIVRHDGGGVNHPIGRLYSEAAQFGGYRSLETISDQVMLPDGRMSCVSCHNGYSQTHGSVVMPEADICFECHDL